MCGLRDLVTITVNGVISSDSPLPVISAFISFCLGVRKNPTSFLLANEKRRRMLIGKMVTGKFAHTERAV